MRAYINEGIRFIRKYLSKILWGGLVLGLVFGAIIYFRSQSSSQETVKELEIEVPESSMEKQVEPAYFQFYIVQPNGNDFTNKSLINDIFYLENVRENAQKVTGINIEKVEEFLNERKAKENPTAEQNIHKVVTVNINDASKIMTAVFDSGNKHDNMSLAKYYYDFLFNEGLNVLADNTLYSIVKPKLVEFPDEDEINEAQQQVLLNTSPLSIVRFIINVIIGIIFSFLLLIILFLVKELFSNKLNFAFTYDRGGPGSFFLYDNKINNPDIIRYFIGETYSEDKILLSEEKLDSSIISEENNHINHFQSMLDIKDLKNIEEIILLVIANETSREWYEKQLELLRMKNIPIKVIQVSI